MVDPITLGAKLVDVRDRKNCGCCDDDFDLASVPESVCRVFDDNLVLGGEQKRVYVSIGVFSIIKLERKVQLLVPSYDFCIPQKECVGATDDIAYRQFCLHENYVRAMRTVDVYAYIENRKCYRRSSKC